MTRTALLDANVLIALFDPEHVHHEAAHSWFGREKSKGWATCPLTENALIRVLSNPRYSSLELRAHEIAGRLGAFLESAHHEFWPDEVSLTDTKLFRLEHAKGHRQLTDLYLLGLACRRSGRLATFDRSIPVGAVRGAGAEHLAVIPA